MKKIFISGLIFFVRLSAQSQPFYPPTGNHALFEKGGEERFFVATPGHNWVSGCYGCVRSDGWQMHEGLDIKCLQRDKRGEPTDPVMAAADGTVAYINDRPSLSNYGRYMVLRHNIAGLDIYSLYAHLSAIADGVKVGQAVRAGEKIAVMGRTSNTRGGITRERAHVHFELDLLYTDHFASWFKKHYPNLHDYYGLYNGQNLVGIDPRLVLLDEYSEGQRFNLLNWIQHRPELCRVLVRKTDFSWLRHYPMLVKNDPSLARDQIAGYEMALDFNGLPFELIPRAASQFKGNARYRLLSVNAAEYTKNPCRRLVSRRGQSWQLAGNGVSLLDLLTY